MMSPSLLNIPIRVQRVPVDTSGTDHFRGAQGTSRYTHWFPIHLRLVPSKVTQIYQKCLLSTCSTCLMEEVLPRYEHTVLRLQSSSTAPTSGALCSWTGKDNPHRPTTRELRTVHVRFVGA